MFKGLFGKKDSSLIIERARNELEMRTAANIELFGLGSADRWDADLDAGTLRFTFSDGKLVTAPVQVIGTYNSLDRTWLWGWDHPSVPAQQAEAALKAREFGEREKLSPYTQRKIVCSEEDAWEFTAVACHLSGSQGAYRGPAGTTYVFMTFGTVTISKPDARH